MSKKRLAGSGLSESISDLKWRKILAWGMLSFSPLFLARRDLLGIASNTRETRGKHSDASTLFAYSSRGTCPFSPQDPSQERKSTSEGSRRRYGFVAEVILCIHRHSAKEVFSIFPLSEIESSQSGIVSQWAEWRWMQKSTSIRVAGHGKVAVLCVRSCILEI